MFRPKYFLLLFVLTICYSGLIQAQDSTDGQLFWLHEEVVKISMWDQYEATSKEWVDLMTQGGLDLPAVYASQRDDGHYYYLIPLKSYADIDKTYGAFGDAISKIGKDKWKEYMMRNNSSMETSVDYIVRRSDKYSYEPKEPRLKPEERGFIHWMFFTYAPGKRQEVLDVLADWKALYEKNNIPDGWAIWFPEVGFQNNMIALTESAKDGADFYAENDKNNKILKDEQQKLWERISANVLTMEDKYGRPRPDLEYMKKK
jgi:hypothetical protein